MTRRNADKRSYTLHATARLRHAIIYGLAERACARDDLREMQSGFRYMSRQNTGIARAGVPYATQFPPEPCEAIGLVWGQARDTIRRTF